MSSGLLGRPYKVFYTAINQRSGVTGIVARILRPDGGVAGPIALTEIGGDFVGVYSFTLNTTESSPKGEYLITITEGSKKFITKVVMDDDQADGGLVTIEPQFDSKVSVNFLASNETIEIITWCEKDKKTIISPTLCSIQVKASDSNTPLWSSESEGANADGVFRFIANFKPVVGKNYYVDSKFLIDGVYKGNLKSFYVV